MSTDKFEANFGLPIGGFTAVPNIIIHNSAYLQKPLDSKLRDFVIAVLSMSYENFSPTISAIATVMGVDERTVQRYKSTLIKHGYLRITPRNNLGLPDIYDFSPLMAELEAIEKSFSANGIGKSPIERKQFIKNSQVQLPLLDPQSEGGATELSGGGRQFCQGGGDSSVTPINNIYKDYSSNTSITASGSNDKSSKSKTSKGAKKIWIVAFGVELCRTFGIDIEVGNFWARIKKHGMYLKNAKLMTDIYLDSKAYFSNSDNPDVIVSSIFDDYYGEFDERTQRRRRTGWLFNKRGKNMNASLSMSPAALSRHFGEYLATRPNRSATGNLNNTVVPEEVDLSQFDDDVVARIVNRKKGE